MLLLVAVWCMQVELFLRASWSSSSVVVMPTGVAMVKLW